MGDFDPKEALALADEYFGRIPRGKNPPPEMTLLRRSGRPRCGLNGEAETNPQVEIDWHTVPFQHKDSYALAGPRPAPERPDGAPLQGARPPDERRRDERAGRSATAQKYAGDFAVEAEAKEGHAARGGREGDLRRDREAEDGARPGRGAPEGEEQLRRAVVPLAADEHRHPLQLIVNDGHGDWREIREGPKKIQAVTAEDVRRVAQTYLTKENRGVATYTRKGGAAPRRPGRPGGPPPGPRGRPRRRR